MDLSKADLPKLDRSIAGVSAALFLALVWSRLWREAQDISE